MIVDTTELRNSPRTLLPSLFAGLGLTYSPSLLQWRSCPKIELDNLGGRHRHLYRRVLESVGLQPATRTLPEIDSFPAREGWRSHVRTCVEIYHDLFAARVEPETSLAEPLQFDRPAGVVDDEPAR